MPVPSNARVQATVLPELVLCPPPDSRLVTFPFTPTLGYNPNMLVPHSSFLPPQSSFIVPDFQPSWYLPTQTVPFYNPCSSNLLLRTARQPSGMASGPPGQLFINIVPAVEAAGIEQSKEQAKSEATQEQQVAPERKEPEGNNPHTETTQTAVCPAAEATLDADVQARHAMEELITFIDELCPQDNAEVKGQEKEKDEASEKKRTETKIEKENRMLLEYLDSVCSGDDFMGKVDSWLNIEYLNLLLTDQTSAALEQEHKNTEDNYLTIYSDLNALDISLLKELEQDVDMTTSANQPSITTNGPAETKQETPPFPILCLEPPDKKYDANSDAQTPTETKEKLWLADPASLCHSDFNLMDDITLPLQSATHCLTFDATSPDHDASGASVTGDDPGPDVSQRAQTPQVDEDEAEQSDIDVIRGIDDGDDSTAGDFGNSRPVSPPAPSPQPSPEGQTETIDETTTVSETEETDVPEHQGGRTRWMDIADEQSWTPEEETWKEGGDDGLNETDLVDEMTDILSSPFGPSREETAGPRSSSPSRIQTRRSTRNTKYKDFELSDPFVAETRAKKKRKK